MVIYWELQIMLIVSQIWLTSYLFALSGLGVIWNTQRTTFLLTRARPFPMEPIGLVIVSRTRTIPLEAHSLFDSKLLLVKLAQKLGWVLPGPPRSWEWTSVPW